MREWRDYYNSFNSWKGLLYRNNYDGIIKRKLLPPVEVNLDPCNNCQLDCAWCNAKGIIKREPCFMDTNHMLELISFCAAWKVKGLCFAGGGEPTLHPDLGIAIEHTAKHGMEPAIITNGLFLDDNQIEYTARYTRWCGVSVDAASPETYTKYKGGNFIELVWDNIKKLVKNNAREVTYKFLIHPGNQHEIKEAARKARELGCTGIHYRLISSSYLKNAGRYDYSKLDKDLSEVKEYETGKFNVYAIRHKSFGAGNRRIEFKKCKASCLLLMLEANGDVCVCIDRKGDSRTRLCSHNNISDITKYWGSDKHFELLDKINPQHDCPKCTMTIYQEQIDAYENDKFCVNFP